jgi:hypothetical protein
MKGTKVEESCIENIESYYLCQGNAVAKKGELNSSR